MIPANRAAVIGVPIHGISWPDALAAISRWSASRESRVVCFCNVHSVVTAAQNAAFGRVVAEADIAAPDGAPVAWMLRRLGHAGQQRINGPDLMWRYCGLAQSRAEPIFFYGSSEETLAGLKVKLQTAFPALKFVGVSPPFRSLTPDEDAAVVDQINESGAGVVFVGLGCPKQELWMAAHRGRIHAVMIGVGAAFDYHAGTLKRAPKWMQDCGLEWCHRLASDPGRLLKRYLATNTLFLLKASRQLLGGLSKGGRAS